VTRNGEEGMKRGMKKKECEDKMVEQSLEKQDRPECSQDRPTLKPGLAGNAVSSTIFCGGLAVSLKDNEVKEL
jgi:hypothetical protein